MRFDSRDMNEVYDGGPGWIVLCSIQRLLLTKPYSVLFLFCLHNDPATVGPDSALNAPNSITFVDRETKDRIFVLNRAWRKAAFRWSPAIDHTHS